MGSDHPERDQLESIGESPASPFPDDVIFHRQGRYPIASREGIGLVLSEHTLAAVQAAAISARIKHRGHSILDDISDGDRLAILGEEFGEVASTLTYDRGTEEERKVQRVKELLQLAAMALSWVEEIKGVKPDEL